MSQIPTSETNLNDIASPQTLSVFKYYEELELKPTLIAEGNTIHTKTMVRDFEIDLITQIDPETNVLVSALIVPLAPPKTHMDAVLELMMRANLELNFGSYEYDYDRKNLIFRMTNIFTELEYDRDIISNILNTSFSSLDEFCICLIKVLETPEHLIDGLSIGFLLEKSNFLVAEETEEEEGKA